MNLPNEDMVLNGVRNHPDREPRAEFVEQLEQKLVREARKMDRKKSIMRYTPWLGGAVAAAVVAVTVLSPDAQQALRGAFVEKPPAPATTPATHFNINDSKLPTGEMIIGRDLNGKPVLASDGATIYQLVGVEKRPLITAQEAFGVQKFDEANPGALTRDGDNIAFPLSAKGKGTRYCFLTLSTGKMQSIEFDNLFSVRFQTLMQQGGEYQIAAAFLEADGTQEIYSINWGGHSLKPILGSNTQFIDSIDYDQTSQTLVLSSPYAIFLWKDGKLSNVAKRQKPMYKIVGGADGVRYYAEGESAIDEPYRSLSFYRGTTVVHRYDLMTREDTVLLPKIEGNQQLLKPFTSEFNGTLIGNFLPHDPSTAEKDEASLHKQSGTLQLWALIPGSAPKMIYQRETTWDQSYLRDHGVDGSILYLEPDLINSQKPPTWRLQYDFSTNTVTETQPSQ